MTNDTEWTMEDGRTIKLSDMTDSHLQNARRFVQRKIQSAILNGKLDDDGDLGGALAELDMEIIDRGLPI